MTEPLRVITEPLGGSPLARAAIEGRAPAGWYATRPRGAEAWRERAVEARSEAGDWLAPLLPALAPSGAAAARLGAAAAGGAVVTTGQQPGLFGGPIYTWAKALSALALADELEAGTGIPTAPVFWAATDDADFDEASWTAVAVAGGVDVLRLTNRPPAGTMMSAAPLGDVGHLLERLAGAAGSASYAQALAAASAAYSGGTSIGGAYVALLRALLEPLGIAVLDAAHPAARAAMFPHVREALLRAGAVDDALRARDAALAAAGYAPKVESVPGLSLVFRTSDGVKQRVPIAAAAETARTAPVGALGPNVLLRPVVERAILPSITYLAGPGEIAYFAQASAVASALGRRPPLALPRWSCTILEPHIQRALHRLGLAPHELEDPHAPEQRLAREALPARVRDGLVSLRAALDDRLRDLAAPPDDGAPPLLPAAALDGARRALEHRLDRLERRYLAAAKRRGDDRMLALATARGALRPLGKRQERALNLIPLLARHGPALLDAMLDAARAHARALVRMPAEPGRPRPSDSPPALRRD